MSNGSTTAAGPKRLSPVKWVIGVLALIAVITTAMAIGLLLRPAHAQAVPPTPIDAIVMMVLGFFAIAMGALLYGSVLLTACFTFNFRKPFFAGFKRRLWVANLLTGLLLQGGFAFIVGAFIQPLLGRAGLSGIPMTMLGFFLPFIVAQFALIWITIWGPLERSVIRRRLIGRGFAVESLAGGRGIGLSDPTRSSFKKFSLVEDDVGMLWIGEDALTYYGDSSDLEIPHSRLVQIERKADAGSTLSYFGGVHVILHFLRPDDQPQQVRLHAGGCWTMTAAVRELNALADRLEAWRVHPLPGWAPNTAAFPVLPPA